MKPGLHIEKRYTARIFATLCITLMVATASLVAGKSQNAAPDRKPTIRFVSNPDLAPEFHLKTLDGRPLALGASQGKVILLNFWATWCGPCRAEIPDLISLQTKYKENLQIIGLVVDSDDDAEVRDIVRNESINYPVAIATNQVRAEYGGIAALPTLFVMDTQGRVVQKHVGLRDPVLYEVEVRALLGLPVPVNVETFEDTGEIFLKHADRASELPGVDLSKLSAEQKTAALHNFNAEVCSCGCKYTLAQCRIYDQNCKVSKDRVGAILDEIKKSSPSILPTSPAL